VNRPQSHTRFEELAAGHALHALEPEDEQAFLAHLASCARCARDLAEHAGVLAQLAYAPDAAEPGPELLERIRAGVAASGRGVSYPGLAERPGEAVSLDSARQRRDAVRLSRAATWTAAAAVLALVLSLGAWNLLLQQEREEQDAWSTRMINAVKQLEDPSTRTVPLTADGGAVVAVALLRGDQMSLVLDGLPVNEAGTSYVLWGESRYGDRRAVGAFDVHDSDLDVLAGMRLQPGVGDVTRLMVTHEKGDVAPPLPTLPVLASGDV